MELLELLADLFSESLVQASGRLKIPLWVNLLLFTGLCAVPITVAFLIMVLAYSTIGFWGALICGAFASLLAALWLFGCWKLIQNWRAK